MGEAAIGTAFTDSTTWDWVAIHSLPVGVSKAIGLIEPDPVTDQERVQDEVTAEPVVLPLDTVVVTKIVAELDLPFFPGQ